MNKYTVDKNIINFTWRFGGLSAVITKYDKSLQKFSFSKLQRDYISGDTWNLEDIQQTLF